MVCEKNIEYYYNLCKIDCSKCKKQIQVGTGCLEVVSYDSSEFVDFFRNRKVVCFQCFEEGRV